MPGPRNPAPLVWPPWCLAGRLVTLAGCAPSTPWPTSPALGAEGGSNGFRVKVGSAGSVSRPGACYDQAQGLRQVRPTLRGKALPLCTARPPMEPVRVPEEQSDPARPLRRPMRAVRHPARWCVGVPPRQRTLERSSDRQPAHALSRVPCCSRPSSPSGRCGSVRLGASSCSTDQACLTQR